MIRKKIASYRIVHTDEGNVYQFFCDLSHALVYESETLTLREPESELMLAWEEGKKHFNLCHKCGKWIIDAMYNPDVMNCVECTPIIEEVVYCPHCGAKTAKSAYYCHKCGSKLLYGKEV